MASDFILQNWREVREQRGLSWDELGDQFAKDGYPDLESWAREEGSRSDKSARANKGKGSKPENAVGDSGTPAEG